MASLTPAQRQIADAMIAGTFDKLDTKGRIQPAESVEQMYAGINAPKKASPRPTQAQMQAIRYVPPGLLDRLPSSSPGLPGPGAGMSPQEVAAMGGYVVDPRTGQLAYTPPSKANPAVAAATQVAQGVPMPRPRPGYAPSVMDIAAMKQGANPGMGGAMIGNGMMAPGIAPQGPPPAGIAPTVWAGDRPQNAPAIMRPGGTVQRANGTNGYIYGRAEGGPWHQQGSSRAPGIGPAQQYAAANLMGQVNALNRKATATGQTGVYNYNNGVRGSTVSGLSSADAYTAANNAAKQKAAAGATKKSSAARDDSGSPFW